MSEEAAYALLFPGRDDAGPVHADPDWARVHRELAKTGVTLKLLHAEYAGGCTEAGAPSMSYDRLCKRSITRLRVDRGEANMRQRRG